MRNFRIILALLSICLVVSACSGDLFVNRSGSIPMQPFNIEELGIRGARPFYCRPLSADTYDCSSLNSNNSLVILNLLSFPGTRQELIALLSEQTNLTELPAQVGEYKRGALTWEIYEFDMANESIGPTVFHTHVALAELQDRYYLIALAALKLDYQLNRSLYLSAFEHTLYAFEPMNLETE